VPTTPTSESAAQTKIVVPGSQAMVALLGSRDELLRIIEEALASDVHVRGNEITISGDPADNALAVRLFEELLELVAAGQTLTADSVRHSLGMLQAGEAERPAEVLSLNILSRRGRTIRPKTLNQTRSTGTRSSSASARPAPARPTWPWPRPCRRCSPSRSTGSS
jgi:phosphate starvation-inducible protein PhoH and related proteins